MAKDKLTDSRFQGVSRDPRFRRPAAKKSKTVIDSRFERIFTDEKFRGTSSSNPRGIPSLTPESKKGKNVNEEMSKFYQLAPASESENETGSDSGDESPTEAEGRFQWDAASSSDDEEVQADEEVHMDELPDEDEEEEDVPLGDSTDKLAIMNCNWDHVTATDLFVLLQSFLDTNAPGRRVLKVSVHQSDFGAERMEREEMYGPLIEGMPEDADEDDSLKTKNELAKLDEQRAAAIRNYERLKRKYYFAIAEFDSINTACIAYDELEGVCGGFVSEALDMRFVPEDTPNPADRRPPVSEADKVPASYSPPKVETGNLTMEHSKVKCTWDEDPVDRKILMKKLTPAQIADLDLAAYLESASEDDEVDAEALRKALLSDGESAASEMGDMEMSFSRAVESVGKSVSKRLAETGSSAKTELSQWDQYLEKKKEAKKNKKLERRQQIDAQKQERIAAARANSSAAKQLAEEDGNSSNDEAVDSATIVGDKRLEKLFSDPKFAVDPTHPNFKKTSVIKKRKL